MPNPIDFCRACGKSSAHHRCSRCATAAYCNRTCQEADWREHKTSCAAPHTPAPEPKRPKREPTVKLPGKSEAILAEKASEIPVAAALTSAAFPAAPNATSVAHAAAVPDGKLCLRCGKDPEIVGRDCCVRHPVHLQEELEQSHGPKGCRFLSLCKACREEYTRGSEEFMPAGPADELPVIEGPEWCYEGVHTVRKPLLPDDARKVDSSVVLLAEEPLTCRAGLTGWTRLEFVCS